MSVYCLVDPRNGEVRYIGGTYHLLSTRLSRHISETRLRHHRRGKVGWIKELWEEGKRPEIVLLEETTEPDAERDWVEYMQIFRKPLLNWDHRVQR